MFSNTDIQISFPLSFWFAYLKCFINKKILITGLNRAIENDCRLLFINEMGKIEIFHFKLHL